MKENSSEFNEIKSAINAQAKENNATGIKNSAAEFNARVFEYENIVENHDSINVSNAGVERAKALKKRKEPTAASKTAANITTKLTPALVGSMTSYVAVVVGLLVVTSTYVGALGIAQASFKTLETEYNAIRMEIAVNEWAEDLGVRLFYDGYTVTYKIPENKEADGENEEDFHENERQDDRGFFFGEYVEEKLYYANYYIEELTKPTQVKVEIVGNVVFMNDILDSKTITVEPYPVSAYASFEDIYAQNSVVSAGFKVYEWTDTLRFELAFNEVIEGFSVPEPVSAGTENEGRQFEFDKFSVFIEGDDGKTYYISYYNEDIPEKAEITLRLTDGDRIVDERTVVSEVYAEPASVYIEDYRLDSDGLFASAAVYQRTDTLRFEIAVNEVIASFVLPEPNYEERTETDGFTVSYRLDDDGVTYIDIYYPAGSLPKEGTLTLSFTDGDYVVDERSLDLEPVIPASAEFDEAYTEVNTIFAEIIVSTWTENLVLDVEYDGKTQTFPIPSPDDENAEVEGISMHYEEMPDGSGKMLYVEYGDGGIADGSVVELALKDGETVLDTAQVELPEIVYADATFEESFAEGSYLSATVILYEWTETLRFEISFDDFEDGIYLPSFEAEEPLEQDGFYVGFEDGEGFRYLYISYESEDLPEGVEITIKLVDGDNVLDSATLTIEPEQVVASASFEESSAEGGYVGATAILYEWTETLRFEVSFDDFEDGVFIPSPEETGYLEQDGFYVSFEDGDGFKYVYISYENEDLPEDVEITIKLVDGDNVLDSATLTIESEPEYASASFNECYSEDSTVFAVIAVDEWTGNLKFSIEYDGYYDDFYIPSSESGEIISTDEYSCSFSEADGLYYIEYYFEPFVDNTECTLSLIDEAAGTAIDTYEVVVWASDIST